MDEREKELVVVEVRCRSIERFQSPEESITPRKLRSLIFAGLVYVDKTKWDGPWRIDIVGIIAPPGVAEDEWSISHIRGIRT
jgi:putative endonuclease